MMAWRRRSASSSGSMVFSHHKSRTRECFCSCGVGESVEMMRIPFVVAIFSLKQKCLPKFINLIKADNEQHFFLLTVGLRGDE